MKLYGGRGIHGETVATIGQRIVSGHYAPGELLFIDALGAELSISRTAIREALRVLAAKGMVDSLPKRGTIVRDRSQWNLLDPDLIAWRNVGDPSPEFLRDLAEVRDIVEPAAARLAAARRDDEDLARLEAALDAMRAAEDADAAIAADTAFHRALLRASHNELLSETEVVIEAWLRVRDRLVHSALPERDPVPEHRAVLDAIRDRAPERAVRAMHRLLDRAGREADEAIPGVRAAEGDPA